MPPRTRLPESWPLALRRKIEPYLEPDQAQLVAISQVITGKRDEAKRARMQSGIEDTWRACEEAYAGIDAANRAEFAYHKWAKSMSMDGPLTRQVQSSNDGKSTIFIPITARYVDAAAAKVTQILLPLDGKPFKFTETPVPELVSLRDGPDADNQIVDEELGPLTRDARPEEVPPNPAGQQPPPVASGAQPAAVPAPADGAVLPAGAAAPPAAPQVPLKVKDVAKEQIAMARTKAEKAEQRVYDWHVECNYSAEARKSIFDCARLGVGVMKGPIPEAKREVASKKVEDGIAVIVRDRIFPATRWVDAWNFYPDPACGENIQHGDHCFERDFISESQVNKLARDPGYIPSQIARVIAEGPGATKVSDDTEKPNKPSDEERRTPYEIWYFHGTLKRDDYWCICHAAQTAPPKEELPEQVYAVVTLINDHVVKATVNPLTSTGALPYQAVPWRRRPGHWAGVGIAEQVNPAQRIVNGAMRAMLNNAGISAGAQIVVNRDAIAPVDGQWSVTPNKFWEFQSDTNMDVDQAFGVFEIPNCTQQMEIIVERGMRLAEESTNMPLVTQGQSGTTQPKTLGGLQLQNNNAEQLLRDVANNFDDYGTEPRIRQYYEYLLLDPDVPDDEKGDFQINAHGSAALVEAFIHDEMLGQMLAVSKDPAYGLNPRRTMSEFLKAKRFNPAMLENTEEEQAKIDSAPPPPMPQVQVAEINAKSRETIAAGVKETEDQRLLVEARAQRDEAAARATELENQVDTLKVKLAETTMELNMQEKLARMADRSANGKSPSKRIRSQRTRTPQVATPAMEPAGRAADGRAFEQ